MEPQRPGALVYPVWNHTTPGLVGTARLALIRDSDQVEVVAASTANVVAIGGVSSTSYRGQMTLPTTEDEYTFVWDNGTRTAGNMATEDVSVSYSAAAAGPTSSLTLAELRQHVETDLEDVPLQLLLDDAYGEIVSRFGDDGDVTRVMYGAGPFLQLRRPAVSVTSIVEANRQRTPLLTLVPGDYALMSGGRLIERLSGVSGYTGVTGCGWAPVVTVVYTPTTEQTLRNRVSVDLVKLAVRYAGVSADSIGDMSTTYGPDYLAERERILQGVAFRRGLRIA